MAFELQSPETEQPELFSVRDTLEAQDPAVVHRFIGDMFDKQYEIEHLIKQAKEVYKAQTGEEYSV